MDLNFDQTLTGHLTSKPQIARVMTENWVGANAYCPACGTGPLGRFPNNRPVADFFCATCQEEFELKSTKSRIGNQITDGAHSAMIKRITSDTNPSFFFLNYSATDWTVRNFLIIPRYFFVPEIIIPRKPLGPTARRSGWIGCNINLRKIPEVGRIYLVRDTMVIGRASVLDTWRKTSFLRERSTESKGWTLDVLRCLDQIESPDFTLADVYRFEAELKKKYRNNNFVRDKIRQQLQVLRDRGIIEFKGRGQYRKSPT